MRKLKQISVLLAVLVLTVGVAKCQSGGAKYTSIKGEFYFLSGDSNSFIHWRGLPPYERYRMGAEVSAENKFVRLYAESTVYGAAMYDNFESLGLQFGAGYKIRANLIAGLHFQDRYSLNRIPVSDPDARHPMSSINQTWLGLTYRTSVRNHPLTVEYWRAIRGSLPLFTPSYHTLPYAKNRFALEYRQPLAVGLIVDVRPVIYTVDAFDKARGVLELEIEKPIWGGKLVLVGVGFLDASLGTGQLRHFSGEPLRRLSFGGFGGLKIPFGHQEQ